MTINAIDEIRERRHALRVRENDLMRVLVDAREAMHRAERELAENQEAIRALQQRCPHPNGQRAGFFGDGAIQNCEDCGYNRPPRTF